jgi:hypothetical protein
LIDTSHDNELFIVHDKILYNLSSRSVLDTCKQFLAANKNEFILMSVKPDSFGFNDAIWHSD